MTTSSNDGRSISIEKSEKRKVIIERLHETGSGNTETEIIVNEHQRSAVISETLGTCPQWLLTILSERETNQPEKKAGIDKVSEILRDNEKPKDCFDPMVVSIGPYHNQDKDKDGNPKFARVEKLKALIAKEFIDRETEKLMKFDEVSRNAKAYYDKKSTAYLSDDGFTCMMFLDGCFVLHFIDCVVNGEPNDPMMKTDQKAFVLRDLFLLENQLPFPVLQALMKFRPRKGEWQDLIERFVGMTFKLKSTTPPEEFDKSVHLLDLLRKQLIGQEQKRSKDSEPLKDDRHSFRSVVELRKAGIKFKKSKHGTLKDVKFEKRGFVCANLFLPQLVIDDSTKSKLLNLVAYEASPDGPSDYVVTSYIVLLDALIDHAEDVKELRSKGILQNLLGSDQKVADLFNELAINLVASPTEYVDVKSKIEKHCKRNISIWMTDLWHTYFSSPWTIIAIFIAASIILLTFAQTYFSIFPRGGSEGERKTPTPRKIHYN